MIKFYWTKTMSEKLKTPLSPNTERHIKMLADEPLLKEITSRLLDVVIILNEDRQVVFANQCLNPDSFATAFTQRLGGRIGDVFECRRTLGGDCGETYFCSQCGANNSIAKTIQNGSSVQEFSMTDSSGRSYDFLISSDNINLHGEKFVLVNVKDISNRKRKEALESIFFHDIINTAGAMHQLIETMIEEDAVTGELLETVRISAKTLLDEINSQKILTDAEADNLKVNLETLSPQSVVSEAVRVLKNSGLCDGIEIVVNYKCPDTEQVTDRTLLKRILINMIKNAVEASPSGAKVTVTACGEGGRITYCIHNENYMNESVKKQIFNRSFTTKGRGRGLGTYSIKLLGEKFLGGNVWFESDETSGTSFFIQFPKSINK